MLKLIARMGRMTCPDPDSLVSVALGARDSLLIQHVEGCSTCGAEVGRLREATGLLRTSALFEPGTETAECLEEFAIADFVEGRLSPEARVPVVTHLLTCARCRSVVRATGRLIADKTLSASIPAPRRHRWVVPLGAAAAAALLLVLLPRGARDGRLTPALREPDVTSTVAPNLIAPRASVIRIDRMVWSRVPRAERYRLHLFAADGSVVWRVETTDTAMALPDSVRLMPSVTYFWRVEAETEWRRWVASDLVEFRLTAPAP